MKNIEIASKYLGIKEKKGKNLDFVGKEKGLNPNYTGKEFENKLISVGFHEGWAWCALFAELVWKESGYEGLENFSANSRKTFSNFKKAGFTISKVPIVGSMPIYAYTNTSSRGHTDTVVTKVLNDKEFYAIGGNVGDMVKESPRKLGSVKNRKCLGFVVPKEHETEMTQTSDCEKKLNTIKEMLSILKENFKEIDKIINGK